MFHGKTKWKITFAGDSRLSIATSLNKPHYISKAGTKIFISGFQAKMRGGGGGSSHSLVEIQ